MSGPLTQVRAGFLVLLAGLSCASLGLALTEEAKLTASDAGAGDRFGSSASAGGDTVVLGAPWDADASGSITGSAFVFVRDADGIWTEQAKLLADDGANADRFGFSVSMSGDTALVGAYVDDDNGVSSGSAYVFVRSSTDSWTQQAKLTASDGAQVDIFGASVAVSGDTALVGALLNGEP